VCENHHSPQEPSGFRHLVSRTRWGVYATSPPTELLGVGLGGDNSPRMIAFQAHIKF
jgi:hypothetical protein